MTLDAKERRPWLNAKAASKDLSEKDYFTMSLLTLLPAFTT